ncbi:MAG: SAM-dependent methyltransferase, partial [uncultured Rubrobacteraceae bacterium]
GIYAEVLRAGRELRPAPSGVSAGDPGAFAGTVRSYAGSGDRGRGFGYRRVGADVSGERQPGLRRGAERGDAVGRRAAAGGVSPFHQRGGHGGGDDAAGPERGFRDRRPGFSLVRSGARAAGVRAYLEAGRPGRARLERATEGEDGLPWGLRTFAGDARDGLRGGQPRSPGECRENQGLLRADAGRGVDLRQCAEAGSRRPEGPGAVLVIRAGRGRAWVRGDAGGSRRRLFEIPGRRRGDRPVRHAGVRRDASGRSV